MGFEGRVFEVGEAPTECVASGRGGELEGDEVLGCVEELGGRCGVAFVGVSTGDDAQAVEGCEGRGLPVGADHAWSVAAGGGGR